MGNSRVRLQYTLLILLIMMALVGLLQNNKNRSFEVEPINNNLENLY